MAVEILVGGSDYSFLLGSGPRFAHNPSGEISGNEGGRVQDGGLGFLGSVPVGHSVRGVTAWGRSVNDEASGVRQKKVKK